MSAWTGRMDVRLLEAGRVAPIEHRDWRDARRYFKARPKHWAGVEEWMEKIRNGRLEPIQIGVSDRYPQDWYVGDGHHRAVALMELGVKRAPFHWYWIRSFGRPAMERGPIDWTLLER